MRELQDRAVVDVFLPPDDDKFVALAGPEMAPYALETIKFAGEFCTMLLRRRGEWLPDIPSLAKWCIRLEGYQGPGMAHDLLANAILSYERHRGNYMRIVLHVPAGWDKREQT